MRRTHALGCAQMLHDGNGGFVDVMSCAVRANTGGESTLGSAQCQRAWRRVVYIRLWREAPCEEGGWRSSISSWRLFSAGGRDGGRDEGGGRAHRGWEGGWGLTDMIVSFVATGGRDGGGMMGGEVALIDMLGAFVLGGWEG